MRTVPSPRLRARQIWISNPSIGYRGIAGEVGVTYQTIARWAKDDAQKGHPWPEARERYQNELRTAAEEKARRDGVQLAEQIEQGVRGVALMTLNKVRAAVEVLKPEDVTAPGAASMLRESAKILMLLAGLPTERSQVEQTATGLEDVPRDQLREWYEDIYRKARGDGKGLSRTAHPEDAVE